MPLFTASMIRLTKFSSNIIALEDDFHFRLCSWQMRYDFTSENASKIVLNATVHVEKNKLKRLILALYCVLLMSLHELHGLFSFLFCGKCFTKKETKQNRYPAA